MKLDFQTKLAVIMVIFALITSITISFIDQNKMKQTVMDNNQKELLMIENIILQSLNISNDINYPDERIFDKAKELILNEYSFVETIKMQSKENIVKNSHEKITSLSRNAETDRLSIKTDKHLYRYIPYEVNGKEQYIEVKYTMSYFDNLIVENTNTFIIQLVIVLIVSMVVASIIARWVSEPMYLAFHDNLTGLYNRAAFENVLKEMIKKKETTALLMIDLDNFKQVNDKLGHDNGDVLLKHVAKKISSCLKGTQSAYRLGGDEFVVILPGAVKEDAELVCQKIIHEVLDHHCENSCKTVEEMMKQINVTVSIGISLAPSQAEDIDTLYKKADIALYYAKQNGKNNYQLYNKNIKS